MKKVLGLLVCALLLMGSVAGAQTLEGYAKGFGGELAVAVEMDGDTIVAVTIVANGETPAIAGDALAQVPEAIVAANSAEVDVVAGATVTSNAIMAAVGNAIDPEANPYVAEVAEPAPLADADLYIGLGVDNMGRIGPGQDSTETPVYSFNQVIASVIFDRDGRIVQANLDQLEIATPNYDGEHMPHFSGFPGQGGYNWDENHDGEIAGKTEDTEENFIDEIASWQTKRERGATYVMGIGTWAQQMDAFEKLFVGKTVEEIDTWFALYTSDRNGRPLKEGSQNEQDAAKWDALSEEDQAMLADVTTSATMSLFDSHGNILAALHKAFENRVPLVIGE